MNKQRGSARVSITLKNSHITVRHMDDDTKLKHFLVKDGDWNKLWLVLEKIELGEEI